MRTLLALSLAAAAAASAAAAQAPPAGASFADEFIRLFKKNHYPVLRRQMELGNILEISAQAPRFHGTEDRRWDYRITLVWKNAAAPHEAFPETELRRLFPDQETFRREEQHRFEILAAHWDLPVVQVDLTKP
jgi:hypothetical protein